MSNRGNFANQSDKLSTLDVPRSNRATRGANV
jgi:hypothetical protein